MAPRGPFGLFPPPTMKRILLVIALAASTSFAVVDISKPIAELVLKDGRTLKNVVFVSYSTSAIMARWEGGRGTISYDVLPVDVGDSVKKMRPKPTPATGPSEPRPNPTPVKAAPQPTAALPTGEAES